MVGEGQLKEQAKHQWERLDAEGCKIINNLLTAAMEKVEWPEDAEPKFTRKRATKATKVAYDSKTKRNTYYDNKVVTTGEPIRLEIPDLFLYFCYHPVRKEYIRINASSRREADTKYIVTVSNCHWIWERNITVLALLAYATRNIQVTRNYVKSAIKEAPTEEVLCTKIAEQKCYTELVETILKGVTDVSQAENPSTKTQENVDVINVVVEFIREKHIKPSCKKLSDDTLFTDFITVAENKTTINSARSMIENKTSVAEFVKDWKEQHNIIVRNKNKEKQKEYMEKDGRIPTPVIQRTKGSRYELSHLV